MSQRRQDQDGSATYSYFLAGLVDVGVEAESLIGSERCGESRAADGNGEQGGDDESEYAAGKHALSLWGTTARLLCLGFLTWSCVGTAFAAKDFASAAFWVSLAYNDHHPRCCLASSTPPAVPLHVAHAQSAPTHDDVLPAHARRARSPHCHTSSLPDASQPTKERES